MRLIGNLVLGTSLPLLIAACTQDFGKFEGAFGGDDAKSPGASTAEAGANGVGDDATSSPPTDATIPDAPLLDADNTPDGPPGPPPEHDAAPEAAQSDASADAGPGDASSDAGPGDASVDAGPGDASSDAGPGDASSDAGPGDASVDARADGGDGGDAGDAAVCTPSVTCIDTARTCGDACGATSQTCQSQCANAACRRGCQSTEATCRTQCATTCDACTVTASCPAAGQCTSAAGA